MAIKIFAQESAGCDARGESRSSRRRPASHLYVVQKAIAASQANFPLLSHCRPWRQRQQRRHDRDFHSLLVPSSLRLVLPDFYLTTRTFRVVVAPPWLIVSGIAIPVRTDCGTVALI